VEGDVVALGDQIAAVRASSDIAEGDAGQVLVEGLATETEAARSVGDASQARLEAEAAQLRRHTASLLAEQQQIIRQIALQEERTRLQQVDVARAQVLADQGFFPRAQLEVRQAQALAAEQDLAALRQRKLSLDRDVIEVAARLDAIPIETSAARAASSMTIAQLEQRRADAQSRTRYIIRSPIAGRVAALPVRAGETLVPGASVATIVPEGSRLEAELYVPSRAAGFIREGQEVRLLYQAFPHQRFGAGHGEVVSVSRTVLTPSEVAMPSVHLDEPVFRVQVRLERDYVDAYGQRTPLQAGMLLTADVVIDRRSLLEWILDPIYAAGRR
jgi:membrane fusion protein